MADRPLVHFFWRADALDYRVTQARLWVVDAVCGPEQTTPADQKREADHEQLRRAFPQIGVDTDGSGSITRPN